MITLLVPPGVSAGRRCRIDDAERHHLRVRRVADGEAVTLRDGAGLLGTGRILATGADWEVEVESVGRSPRPAETTLVVGAGDRDRFTWLIEKAAELGVTRIVPLETERTRGVASRVREEHLARLRRHALQAVKQCGAAWAPEVTALARLDDLLASEANGQRWLGDAGGTAPPEVLGPTPVTVVVGPEGGLDDGERGALAGAGFRPVALSPHTLRFETAALAAAAAVAAARIRGNHD